MLLPASCVFALTGCIAAIFFVAKPVHAQAPTTSSAPLASMSAPAPTAMLEVANIDLKRYTGLWYEQARLPNRFQRKCAGQVTARYAPLPDGKIDVLNRCAQADGSIDEASGVARRVAVPGRPDAGRLQVRFVSAWLGWLPFVWGDYWVLQIDPDYQVSVVGTPDRKYLWVLSRQPRLDDARLQAALDYARSAGFAVDEVTRTPATPPLSPAP